MKKSFDDQWVRVFKKWMLPGIIAFSSCFTTQAQLVFHEVSGDSGNNDGTNDGIVELINTGGTDFDAGCYVISNAEWVVVLPPGTTIPAGEVFLIACSEGQNTGTNPNPVEGSGITCATCDFPDMPIDFDVCDPVNANYVDWAATGFTIDNQNDTDGDQLVLFAPNGTILQAVKWGGGATGMPDNTALQSGSYTLGTPGTGGSGLSSAQLPVSLQPGGDCHQMGVNYTMPMITDNLYEDLTNTPNPGGKVLNNSVLQGCNSSFIYDPTMNSWSKTDYPNPGEPNDALAYDVQFSAPLIQCENSTQSVTVTLEVYNWQAVTPGITNAKAGVGSFVSFDGGATRIPWAAYNRNDATGITTLTYTFTPTMNETLTIVWNDDNSSPLASTPTGSSSPTAVVNNTTPSDCYTVEQYQVVVAPVMMASQTNVACPTDFAVGTVNIGSLITGGDNVTYELFDDGVSQSTNSTGIFNISDNFTGPITVVVTDGSGCTSPITVNINNNCRQAPPCPELIASADDDADDQLCPGDQVCFDITMFNDLPEGGTIDYYFDTDANFNPYAGDGTLLGSADITGVAPNCPADGANVLITELGDHPNADCERFIEIFNAGPCDADLSTYELGVVLNGSETRYNLSGTLPVGAFLVFGPTNDYTIGGAGAACNVSFIDVEIDFNEFQFNGQQHDGARLYQNNTLVDDAVIDETNSSSVYADRGWERDPNITEPSATYNANEWSLQLESNGTQSGGSQRATIMSIATVDQFCYTFDESFCNLTMNGAFYVKAVVNPFDEFTGCLETDADRFESFTFNMSCPSATLSGGGTECSGNTVPLEIDFDNYTGNPTFTIEYTVDGLPQMPIMTMDDPYQLDAGASGEYILTGVSVDGTNCEATAGGSAIVQINDAPMVTLSGTLNDVCIDGFANIPLTISQGTLPMMITYDIDNGTPETVEIFDAQLNIPTTGLAADNAYTVNITAVEDANGCMGNASGSATINTINCGFTCPTIAALNTPTEVIAGSDFDVAALGLADMAMADNAETDFGIEFVYFSGTTPPPDPYASGTSLGAVLNMNLSGLTNPGQFATLNTASITATGTYQVCAILDAMPADANCRPAVCQTVNVNECEITINSVNLLDCVHNEYELEVEIIYTNAPTGDITITPAGETAQNFTPMSDADSDGIICDEPVCLDARAILGGAYFEVGNLGNPADPVNGWMRDDLRTLADFPLTEPYTDLGFAHAAGGGGEMTTAGVLAVTGANAIVDWVFLELRSSPTEVVATRSALLQRDGDIVDVDGASSVTFDAPPGDYFVTIRHRNHLSVTTATPTTFAAGTCSSVDFTMAATDVYNITTPENYAGVERWDLGGGLLGLWPGDAEMDGDVQANADFIINPINDVLAVVQRVLNDPANIFLSFAFQAMGYNKEDLNMNGGVALTGVGNDVDIVVSTVENFPLNTTGDLDYRVLEQYQAPTSISTISACSSDTETFTLTGLPGDGSTGIDVTAAFADQTACTVTSTDAYDAPQCFTCPTITALTAPDRACVGSNFDLEATGLANMAMIDNSEADFGIEFVYFTGMTPPADPYTGGTSLGTVANGNLTGSSPNQSALLEDASIGTAGTYQICALLDAAPTSDMDCRPAVCETIRIVEEPVLTAMPTDIALCVSSINDGSGDISTMDVQFDLVAMPNIVLETGETLRYRIRNLGLGTEIDDPNTPPANVSAMPAADANGLTTILNPGDNQLVTISDDITIANPENLLEPMTITYAIFPRLRFADGNTCDGEDIIVTVTIHPAPAVEAGEAPGAICSSKKLNLSTLNASITLGGQPFSGTWIIKENDSNGMFLDDQMQPLADADFGQAIYFMPGDADAGRGFVTLVLTSEANDPCDPVRDEVEITVLKVDCGTFPWRGNE